MARPVLALVLLGCMIVGGMAQCNSKTSTQKELSAGCDPLMKRTTRKLQEANTIPGLGGLMQGISGLGNVGGMFNRVGQFFTNLRPGGAARGGGQQATELTPVRESPSRPSTPRPSRSSDRLESGRSSDRSSEREERSARLERRDRDDHDSQDDSIGRRDTVTIPRSDRGRDRESRSDRRSSRRGSSSSSSRSSRSEGRVDTRIEAAARAQPVTTMYAPQFVEVTPELMAAGAGSASQQSAHLAANRKIVGIPK
ncbi:hypothetical protein COO60DRAFT_688810 [Scenedesmus sp. NREL 46B-D3]|nr:hypothetical protein COO60DRAFT_688810 [Scenedesmus sp. NREL 46B-D3]